MTHVGIDLHKLESQICVLTEQGEVVLERRVSTRRDTLEAALAPFPGSQVLIEACNESEWVARHLESCGHHVIVADPNYTPMYGHRHRGYKTDRRDAAALAASCRQQLYRRAHRTSEERRLIRAELSVRETLVRTRTRYISVLRARLRSEGWRIRSGSASSFGARVDELLLPDALREELQPLLRIMAALNQEVAELEDRLHQRTKTDPVIRRLQTMPQIGPITALAFVASIDRVDRFHNAHRVASYLGLVPRERSSGEHQLRGHITKTGDKRMRWLLVETAWRMMRSRRPDVAPLQRWAIQVAARRGRSIAVVALARRLAGILYAMWRDEVTYDSRKLDRAGLAMAS